jgi:hypothetical protein
MKKENLSGSPVVSSESTQSLMQDLRQIIDQAKGRVASTANYENCRAACATIVMVSFY